MELADHQDIYLFHLFFDKNLQNFGFEIVDVSSMKAEQMVVSFVWVVFGFVYLIMSSMFWMKHPSVFNLHPQNLMAGQPGHPPSTRSKG